MSEKEELIKKGTFSGESTSDLKREVANLNQKVANLEQCNNAMQQEIDRLKKCEIALRNEIRSIWSKFQIIQSTSFQSKSIASEIQQDLVKFGQSNQKLWPTKDR